MDRTETNARGGTSVKKSLEGTKRPDAEGDVEVIQIHHLSSISFTLCFLSFKHINMTHQKTGLKIIAGNRQPTHLIRNHKWMMGSSYYSIGRFWKCLQKVFMCVHWPSGYLHIYSHLANINTTGKKPGITFLKNCLLLLFKWKRLRYGLVGVRAKARRKITALTTQSPYTQPMPYH